MNPSIITEWSLAAEKGGPWFIVTILTVTIVFGLRWFVKRLGEKETEITELNKAAIEREKKCATDQQKALEDLAKLHQERYDALREESRLEHQNKNSEIKEVVVAMTNAIANDIAAKQMLTKAMDDVQDEISKLSDLIRNVRT